jgi:hypothetical protein
LEVKTIRATEDYRIKAHECKLIQVDGDFSEDKEWLVERSLLANAEDSFFTVPNVLITARKPIVPVSNMSDRPRMIRKGEILGQLTDPQRYFNSPGTEEGLEKMKHQSDLLGRLDLVAARAEIPSEQSAKGSLRRPSGKLSAFKQNESGTRIRTDFGTGVPPDEVNTRRGVHVRDLNGNTPDAAGTIKLREEEAETEQYGPKLPRCRMRRYSLQREWKNSWT